MRISGGRINAVNILHENSLVGPVVLERDVALPTDPLQVQGVRAFRAALMRIHNLDAAGHVHAAEQRLSRADLPTCTDRFLSWAYDLTSSYGNETGKPLRWALVFALASVWLLEWGGTQTTRPLVGWQEVMAADAPASSVVRAAYLTVNQVFSPLGVFGGTPLVTSVSAGTALASTILCLLSTTALAFFALALRRRFRIAG